MAYKRRLTGFVAWAFEEERRKPPPAVVIVGGVSSLRADFFLSKATKMKQKTLFYASAGVRAQEPLDASAAHNQCRMRPCAVVAGAPAFKRLYGPSVLFVVVCQIGNGGMVGKEEIVGQKQVFQSRFEELTQPCFMRLRG